MPVTKGEDNSNNPAKADYFKSIRPYLFKLFTHFLLIFLSVRAFYQFKGSEANYNDFLEIMNEPVIIDIKEIDSDSDCEFPYESIQETFFPSTYEGCRCDYNVFQNNTCKMLYARLDKSALGVKMTDLQCKVQDVSLRFDTEKDLNNKDRLRQLFTVPRTCGCFQFIEKINTEKKINRWYKDKKLCVLKDQETTTLNYLKSAFEPCDEENRCQRYFCKRDNDKNNKCPIVDVYFRHTHESKSVSSTPFNTLKYNSTLWTLFTSTSYNASYIDEYTTQNTLLPPMMGIHLSRSGKCENGEASLITNYALIPDVKCSISQRFYSSSKQSVKEVLNANDDYFDYLSDNLPLFKIVMNNDSKWNFDLEYAFYRDTITCLMKKYDDVFKMYYTEINESTVFKFQLQKLSNVLSSFIKLDKSSVYLKYFQVFILIMNLFVLASNLIIIVYKFIKAFKPIPHHVTQFFNKEIYISFSLDVLIAVLGGISYFILYYYIDFLSDLFDTNCADDDVKNKLNLYSEALQQTADENLQIFLIVIFRISLIIFSIFYYFIAEKCKMTCSKIANLIKENLNEGDDPDKDEEAEVKDKKNTDNTESNNENEERQDTPISQNEKETNIKISENKTCLKRNLTNQNYCSISNHFFTTYGSSNKLNEYSQRKESNVELVPQNQNNNQTLYMDSIKEKENPDDCSAYKSEIDENEEIDQNLSDDDIEDHEDEEISKNKDN